MVLEWLSRTKAAGIDELVARRSYGPALELIQAQLKEHARNERLRLQLAHVLTLAGRRAEAAAALDALAQDLAADGFFTKAIAVLKKVQKLEPGRSGVDERIACLVEGRTPPSPSAWAESGLRPGEAFEIGMELIEPSPIEVAADGELVPPAAGDPSGSESDLGIALAPVTAPAAPAAPEPRAVETPLFRSLSPSEALAVIRGLRLRSFGPGHILVTEGEPGGSLYVLTTGVCRAWVRDARGRNLNVRELSEGDFFGEISVLTGQPRTATITTVTACELLELDRDTLDSITSSFPRVREVLEEFHALRAGSTIEAAIRSMGAS